MNIRHLRFLIGLNTVANAEFGGPVGQPITTSNMDALFRYLMQNRHAMLDWSEHEDWHGHYFFGRLCDNVWIHMHRGTVIDHDGIRIYRCDEDGHHPNLFQAEYHEGLWTYFDGRSDQVVVPF